MWCNNHTDLVRVMVDLGGGRGWRVIYHLLRYTGGVNWNVAFCYIGRRGTGNDQNWLYLVFGWPHTTQYFFFFLCIRLDPIRLDYIFWKHYCVHWNDIVCPPPLQKGGEPNFEHFRKGEPEKKCGAGKSQGGGKIFEMKGGTQLFKLSWGIKRGKNRDF